MRHWLHTSKLLLLFFYSIFFFYRFGIFYIIL